MIPNSKTAITLRLFITGLLALGPIHATMAEEKADVFSPAPCNECEEPPKTLLEWTFGCGPCEEIDWLREGNGNGENGNGEPEEIEPLVTDRPDFTESSSTVGLGRIQLESGYTYEYNNRTGAQTRTHSAPEALLRIGLGAEWLELRIGWNYLFERSTAGGMSSSLDGFDDLLLGAKIALTEQECIMPETAIILQTFAPVGDDAFSADEWLPGVNFLYSWELNDTFSLAGSTGAFRAIDDLDHDYIEFTQSVALGMSLTDCIGAYAEWYAFFPDSAVAPDVGAQHFINGGFTYLFSPDFQIDWRIGFGLNERAADFFTGAGFAVRF